MSEHRAPVPAWDPRAYLKALAGALGAALTIIAVPLAQGHPPVEADWWRSLGAAVTVLVTVYLSPNRDTP